MLVCLGRVSKTFLQNLSIKEGRVWYARNPQTQNLLKIGPLAVFFGIKINSVNGFHKYIWTPSFNSFYASSSLFSDITFELS